MSKRLNFLEEAEIGYKRTLELGNYELDTWLDRSDILIALGEYKAAIFNLIQAIEFYPDNAEIEYRLTGLFMILNKERHALNHLINGMKIQTVLCPVMESCFLYVTDDISLH